ncbi:hypothetical protein ABPG74_012473 [Tetrahymena malaccensis]
MDKSENCDKSQSQEVSELLSTEVEEVDLNKYLSKENDLEFTYQSVYKEVYKGNYNKAHMQERLDQFKPSIGENQFDHQIQKMSGRAAIQLHMKKTGEDNKTLSCSKQLLDIIFRVKKSPQDQVDQLKEQIISDIEKRFSNLKM